MSVFKLDRDAFDRQLAAMEATGQAFEKAQSAFAVAAHSAAAELAKSGSSGASGASFGLSGSSGGVQWSGVGELVQFGSPLRGTAVMVDKKMSTASRLEKPGWPTYGPRSRRSPSSTRPSGRPTWPAWPPWTRSSPTGGPRK